LNIFVPSAAICSTFLFPKILSENLPNNHLTFTSLAVALVLGLTLISLKDQYLEEASKILKLTGIRAARK